MSFSNSMKADLCRILPERECCLYSELLSMIVVNGLITSKSSQENDLRLVTENASVAKRIYMLVKETLKINPGIIIRKSKKLKDHNIFIINISKMMLNSKIPDEFLQLITIGTGLALTKELLKGNCCRRSFLRGIFLGAGSVTNPNNCYHLEIVIKDFMFANEVRKMLGKFKLNAKTTMRKNNHIIYIKEVEHIADFLNLIGAHKALLDLENIRILKEMRNSVNRIVNCETANLTKIVDASVRHVNNIKYLQDIDYMDRLPESLAEVAYLRLKYPDSSLKELGMMLDPPVGKSGINHRLRKIDLISEELQLQKSKEENI